VPHIPCPSAARSSPLDSLSFRRATKKGTRSPTPASTRCVSTRSIQRFENAIAGTFGNHWGIKWKDSSDKKKTSRKCTSAWLQRCLQKRTGCELWSISAFNQAFGTCFEAPQNSLLHLLTGDCEADHEIRKASKIKSTYGQPAVLDSLGEISWLLLKRSGMAAAAKYSIARLWNLHSAKFPHIHVCSQSIRIKRGLHPADDRSASHAVPAKSRWFR
jgi:hypothetical protein